MPIAYFPFRRSLVDRESFLCKQGPSYTKFYLPNLRALLISVYLFEPFRLAWIQNLSTMEAKLLKKILRKKKFHEHKTLCAAVDSVKSATPNLAPLKKMHRIKRKEENIKFAFRIIVRAMQMNFVTNTLQRKYNQNAKLDLRTETLFYLFYFGPGLFAQPFSTLAAKFEKDTAEFEAAQNRLRKFMFPDVHRKNEENHKKTMSKSFFKSLAESPKLIRDLNDLFLKTLAFISVIQSGKGDLSFTRRHELDPALPVHQNIIHSISINNHMEIVKMYTEWENLIARLGITAEKTELERGESKISVHRVIDENINKSNFKIPWSFVEVRAAFLDSFLWMNEFVFHKSYPDETKGIINSILYYILFYYFI